MKQMMTMLAAMLFLAGAARAGAPAPASRAQRLELREGLKGDKRRLKQVGVEQHKELMLVREREKFDLAGVKASAARGACMPPFGSMSAAARAAGLHCEAARKESSAAGYQIRASGHRAPSEKVISGMTDRASARGVSGRKGLRRGARRSLRARRCEGQIVARGHNQRVQTGDPTAHAEVVCLRNAAVAAIG